MNDCIFCKIVKNQIPAVRIYEDDDVIVIKDINPQAPIHLLAIPKDHFSAVHTVPENRQVLFCKLFEAIARVLTEKNIAENGYRLVINSGESAGQTVHHLHVHLLSGREFSASAG